GSLMTTITMDDGRTFLVTESVEVVVTSLQGASRGQGRGFVFAQFTNATADAPEAPIYLNVDHISSVEG
ncbi:MAG TPA: hypothetical protein VLA89_10235, partial [Gemmatimonadales bacterium]|nr:hypothetical protein [Gemmatimonadales bacterium]